MFGFIRESKRRRKMKKVKVGDGHLLKPYRIWNLFTHSLFHAEVKSDTDGETVHYAIKSKFFAEEPRADLYREGRHVAFSKLPAAFPVDYGVIEITNNFSGINRIQYISDRRDAFSVYPDKRSLRGFRLWVHKRFPIISRFIEFIAIATLIMSLGLSVPQLMETITEIPWISDNIGVFESPIKLSIWTNFFIGVAAAIAGTERALMLRRHWLIDIETASWSDS
ncbi:hypothetical protein GKZ89_20610 [Bacillus mangrovi]|uniref:Uncharacterized protein n=1 Tax=Metabacillus mangrovi TaxID=1491830 RepID=A0A7X2SA31_9BACI|nr:hypothetical protein [Metabacillus mangrovi]MTH55796.1 hypothetical protein [Metabacillus mangrovi]